MLKRRPAPASLFLDRTLQGGGWGRDESKAGKRSKLYTVVSWNSVWNWSISYPPVAVYGDVWGNVISSVAWKQALWIPSNKQLCWNVEKWTYCNRDSCHDERLG
jgi:hypothetical protein